MCRLQLAQVEAKRKAARFSVESESMKCQPLISIAVICVATEERRERGRSDLFLHAMRDRLLNRGDVYGAVV